MVDFFCCPDGREGRIPSKEADTNKDGIIDLPEFYAVAGQTMVPFDDAPQDINIHTITTHTLMIMEIGPMNLKYRLIN